MNVREILTKWGFQIETEKLEGVEKQLDQIKNRLNALVAVEIIRGLVDLTEKFGHFAIELQVAAGNAGLTVEQFQKLSFAAGQNAVSSEEMGTAMFRLSRQIYQARLGSQDAVDAFRRVGISGDQVRGFKTAGDALRAISVQFSQMGDPIQKSALAMQLMGRGSKQMVDFLSKGPAAIAATGEEFDKLGAVLKSDQIEALVKLEHAFQKVKAVLEAVFATIAAKVAPIFEFIIDDFLKFTMGSKDFIDTKMDDFFMDLAYALGFIWGVIKGLAWDVTHLFDALGIGHEGLLRIIEVLAFAVGIFGALEIAIKGVTLAFAVLTSPILLAIAAITEIIVVIHDLYALATGGKTWSGQILDWLGHFKALKGAIDSVREAYEGLVNLTEKGIGLAVNVGKGIAGGAANGLNFIENLGSGTFGQQGAFSSISNSTGGNASYAFQTDVHVNVPAGSDANQVASLVKDAIDSHHSQKMRETQRGVTNTIGY